MKNICELIGKQHSEKHNSGLKVNRDQDLIKNLQH